jgi:hypothetical protein
MAISTLLTLKRFMFINLGCSRSLSQMTTRSNTPASPKRWDKSGYVTVLTSSKLQWGEGNPPLKPRTC